MTLYTVGPADGEEQFLFEEEGVRLKSLLMMSGVGYGHLN